MPSSRQGTSSEMKPRSLRTGIVSQKMCQPSMQQCWARFSIRASICRNIRRKKQVFSARRIGIKITFDLSPQSLRRLAGCYSVTQDRPAGTHANFSAVDEVLRASFPYRQASAAGTRNPLSQRSVSPDHKRTTP